MLLDSGSDPPRLTVPKIRLRAGLPGVTLAIGFVLLAVILAFPQKAPPTSVPLLPGPVLVHHGPASAGLLYIDTR